VNNQGVASALTLTINGFASKTTVNAWTLANPNLSAANTPSNPTNVSPVQSTLTIPSGGGNISLPMYSFFGFGI